MSQVVSVRREMLTMRAYGMRGTPTTVLIDARGRLRQQIFGVHDDLALGRELQPLILEAQSESLVSATANASFQRG